MVPKSPAIIVSGMATAQTRTTTFAEQGPTAPLPPVERLPPNGVRGRGRVTIAQIAKESGLSTATVSKVLNGRSDVSARTRLLVQEVLVELGLP